MTTINIILATLIIFTLLIAIQLCKETFILGSPTRPPPPPGFKPCATRPTVGAYVTVHSSDPTNTCSRPYIGRSGIIMKDAGELRKLDGGRQNGYLTRTGQIMRTNTPYQIQFDGEGATAPCPFSPDELFCAAPGTRLGRTGTVRQRLTSSSERSPRTRPPITRSHQRQQQRTRPTSPDTSIPQRTRSPQRQQQRTRPTSPDTSIPPMNLVRDSLDILTRFIRGIEPMIGL